MMVCRVRLKGRCWGIADRADTIVGDVRAWHWNRRGRKILCTFALRMLRVRMIETKDCDYPDILAETARYSLTLERIM